MAWGKTLLFSNMGLEELLATK